MRHIEDNIQIACVTWFSLQYRNLSPLLHHSPNGGKRNAREGKRFKEMGTRPGFPDLILLYPSAGHPFLAVELKSPEGVHGDYQKAYQRLVEGVGGKYVVCRSFDEFREEVLGYLGG
jgi:hypothetical protein